MARCSGWAAVGYGAAVRLGPLSCFDLMMRVIMQAGVISHSPRRPFARLWRRPFGACACACSCSLISPLSQRSPSSAARGRQRGIGTR